MHSINVNETIIFEHKNKRDYLLNVTTRKSVGTEIENARSL